MTTSQIQSIESKYNVRVLYLTKSGSHLYGTNDDKSDTDFKGVYLPAKSNLLLGDYPEYINADTNKSNEANSSDDIDCHLDSLHKWVGLLAKGETNAIDTLFSMWSDSMVYCDSNFVKVVKDNYLKLITRNPHAFVGYCISQTRKYNVRGERYLELEFFIEELESYVKSFEHLQLQAANCKISAYGTDIFIRQTLAEMSSKYIQFVDAPAPRGTEGNWTYLEVLGRKFAPTVSLEYLLENITKYRDDYGNRVKQGSPVDWKAMSHAVRVILEVEELLSTKHIQFPLKDRQYIYAVKRGNINLDDVQQFLTEKIDNVDALLETTDLPKSQDKLWINQFILSLYGEL